jgi:class 3 adenylate cyclase
MTRDEFRTRCEPLLIPAIVTAMICLTLTGFFEREGRRLHREATAEWEESAQQAASLLQAQSSLWAQGERLGFFLRERAQREIRRRTDGSTRKGFGRAFQKTVPQAWKSPSLRTYLVEFDDAGHPHMVSGPGMATENRRAFQTVISAMVNCRRDDFQPASGFRAAEKLAKSLLGPYCELKTLGKSFRGRLLPGKRAGQPFFFLWDLLAWENQTKAAYLLVFPAETGSRVQPIKSALKSIEERFRGRLIPGILSYERETPVLKTASRHPDVTRAWRQFLKTLPANEEIPHNSCISSGDWWFFRTVLSEENPKELLISSRQATALQDASRRIATVWRVYFLSWGMITFLMLALPAPPFISLHLKFAGNFFLVGSFSLLVLNVAGNSRNSMWAKAAENALLRESRTMFEEWRESEAIVFRHFVETAKQFFNQTAFWRNFLRANPSERRALAQQVFSFFSQGESGLDFFLAFEPGRDSTFYTRVPSLAMAAEHAMDFYAPAIHFFFKQYHLPGEIGLSPFQKTLSSAFAILLNFPQAIFFDALRVGDLVKAGSEESFFSISEVIAESGQPRLFLVFRREGTKSCRDFIATRIREKNVTAGEKRFFLGAVQPGGFHSIIPDQLSGFRASIEGRKMHDLLERTAIGRTDHLARSGNHLLLSNFCPLGGELVIGALLPTSALQAEVRNANRFLAASAGICLLLLTFVGIGVSRHLFQPLSQVEHGLSEVCRGNLHIRLGMDRPDELGAFSDQCDRMILGFHQRRELGRFVSGQLEDSVTEEGRGHLVSGYRYGTILTSDIRNFTTISEAQSPRRVVALLNRHMEAMSTAILHERGRIDKFVGDAIIAIFTDGTPEEQAKTAIRAGLAMRRAMNQISREAANNPGEVPYEMGVGIDSGELFTAPLGEGERLDYLIIGPPREGSEKMEILSKQGIHSRVVVSPTVCSLSAESSSFHALGNGEGYEVILPLEETPEGTPA